MDIEQYLRVAKNKDAAETLVTYLKTASENQLFHIDIYRLADEHRIPRTIMLETCVQALNEGLLVMEWVYHCPHCGGVPKEVLSLHEATHEDYCPVCKITFQNVIDQNIEILFSLHPSNAVHMEQLKDRYHSLIRKEIMNTMQFNWQRATTVYASEIVQNPLYRDYFGTETLPQDQSLELMNSTILFTDIKGSTQMYSELGDAKAFTLVREHFRILFKFIEKYNGLPVKTIGDAVMGSFLDGKNAILAAVEAQRALQAYYQSKPEAERIEVKIGIHSGPTILVTLNNRLDYFGTTVNLAARIQGIAQPNEIVLSEKVVGPEAHRKLIASYFKKVYRSTRTFKGLDGTFLLYHLRKEFPVSTL